MDAVPLFLYRWRRTTALLVVQSITHLFLLWFFLETYVFILSPSTHHCLFWHLFKFRGHVVLATVTLSNENSCFFHWALLTFFFLHLSYFFCSNSIECFLYHYSYYIAIAVITILLQCLHEFHPFHTTHSCQTCVACTVQVTPEYI